MFAGFHQAFHRLWLLEQMPWLRLIHECDATCVAPLSELFEQFGAIAVSSEATSSEERFAGVAEEPVYWHRTAVSALFDESIDLDILLACSRNRIGTQNLISAQVEAVADENWVEAHRTEQGSSVFAGRLCIRPSWVVPGQEYPATVVLDPGLAFGTGKHATTALCLEWLASHELVGKRIIDYGCGSGILGLAAASLGALKVDAVDIDPQALLATKDNAYTNSLEDKIRVCSADGEELSAADILIANILLNPLTQLAPRISKMIVEQGQLVLSGILAAQVEECLVAYSPWFNMNTPIFQNEWALLEGVRLSDED